MESHDYAVASLAELEEEFERLGRLSASPEIFQATFARSSSAMLAAISSESRPWLEGRLGELQRKFGALLEPVEEGQQPADYWGGELDVPTSPPVSDTPDGDLTEPASVPL